MKALFIFISEATRPLVLERRLTDKGRIGREFHCYAWGRAALFWMLCMCVQGNLLVLAPIGFSPHNNILQTIAVGYGLIVVTVLVIRRQLRGGDFK